MRSSERRMDGKVQTIGLRPQASERSVRAQPQASEHRPKTRGRRRPGTPGLLLPVEIRELLAEVLDFGASLAAMYGLSGWSVA